MRTLHLYIALLARLVLLPLCAAAGTMGCVASQTTPAVPAYDPALVSGAAIFGTAVAADEAPSHDVLGVTPEMIDYVGDIGEARLSVMRFTRLLRRLQDSGFFDNRYDASVTRTAAETFEAQVGNCISYTNLFVALARLSGLTVHYQLAEVPYPTWNAHTGLLIRNNHINVLVDGARFDRSRPDGYTIDFNEVNPDVDARLRRISDAYAESLFYANLSVDEILAGNERRAFAYLLRAIDIAPENADLWINLGAFYSRHGAHEEALESYHIAQALKPREKLILSGLERSHRALGNTLRADELAGAVRRYRLRNPFYHFALAQTAYDAGDYARSLRAILEAQRLKRRNPRFHYMESLVHLALEDQTAASRSLRKAQRYRALDYGKYDDLIRRYGRIEVSTREAADVGPVTGQ